MVPKGNGSSSSSVIRLMLKNFQLLCLWDKQEETWFTERNYLLKTNTIYHTMKALRRFAPRVTWAKSSVRIVTCGKAMLVNRSWLVHLLELAQGGLYRTEEHGNLGNWGHWVQFWVHFWPQGPFKRWKWPKLNVTSPHSKMIIKCAVCSMAL